MKLSIFQKGYVAALIDGEGTIHINKRWSKRSQRYFMLAEIVIGNTSLPLLENAKNIIGGSLREIKPTKNHKKNHKKMYRLERRNLLTVENIVNILIPYLIVKRRQAKLMAEYCQNRLKVGKTWTKAYAERDFQIYEEMKLLNKRGTSA